MNRSLESFINVHGENCLYYSYELDDNDMFLDYYTQMEYDVYKLAYDAQQAIIDRLMLEYCSNEMTEQQWKEYENSVAVVST